MGLVFNLESAIINGEDSAEVNKQEQKYLDYLEKHISGVRKGFEKYFLPIIDKSEEDFESSDFDLFSLNELKEAIIKLIKDKSIENHDKSKYSDEEFDGYRLYFDPTEYENSLGEDFHRYVVDRFNKAWKHHYQNNDHHPHFWINIKENRYMDMPLYAIVHMLSDWSSFVINNGGSTVEWWETDSKDERYCMTENTIKIVYKLLKITNMP
jgi:hypothetical protein